ncbi:uncharacterized protein LOC129938339 isoform X1 [Eupeodes corollae]|uniref:uncharacterized protein LOC129938339 isoform X1 n=1 Tax=Eupeodes corollae TaxID=290404 RepID=UPI00249121BC|nr:uncharacterized protein LOC129938339 isoform X1 [Eupeodes corollae]XP_055901796.1 uncharacterized protein LOC129938339 isoform X1 [Eupeodes corollae]XP_055901797.1 uncharacterized protein LOC129938339 isoform X1 [Eupeodes corollae]XP_055901798.1 uncharacterized protein LOC129938339 isoform X1 [Eupeodes corollae]
MSQNQSYFWQTTRHNVYLKRSAKYHLMMALMVVLAFSTVCLAELDRNFDDDSRVKQTEEETKMPIHPENALKPIINEQNVGDSPIEHKIETPSTKGTTSASNLGFIHAFIASISVILVSELGDKTFFIAAIMAMRHARLTVFVGAIAALGLMTVLSAVFGMAATIIPRVYTYYISTALFAIFGLKMLKEGYYMKATDAQEELEEVQSDLRKREDELKQKMHGGYEETDGKKSKRKNSNNATTSDTIGTRLASNAEMHHRQRKQAASSSTANNNNNETESDEGDEKSIQRRAILPISTNAIMNNLNDENTAPKILQNNGSPSFSTSTVESTVKINTNCDKLPSGNGKVLTGDGNGEPAAIITSENPGVHSTTSHSSVDLNTTNSISNNSLSNTTAGQSNGKLSNCEIKTNGMELKQLGSKKRLDREVSSTLVQDPESGVIRKNAKRSGTYMASRIFMQAFTMTFLAEWGDRSQLTTIILSAREDVYGVIVGGVLGHSMCTGLAVIGGRMIAQKISVKTVTIVGGIVFLLFAITSLFMSPQED